MAENPFNWLKVSLHHPPATTEAVSSLLFDAGAGGLWEDPPDERGRLVMLAGFPPADQARLEAALPEIVARLAAAFDLPAADFAFSLTLEKNHDWAEKWKEGLKPILGSPRLAVAPPGGRLTTCPPETSSCASTPAWPLAAATTPPPGSA